MIRRYLEIVIRLSNIGTKLVIIMNRMRKMIYDPVKHSSEQALCTIYTSDSMPLPLFRYDKHRTIHCFLSYSQSSHNKISFTKILPSNVLVGPKKKKKTGYLEFRIVGRTFEENRSKSFGQFIVLKFIHKILFCARSSYSAREYPV